MTIDRRIARPVRGDRARDAAGRARPDDPGHGAADHRRRPRADHRRLVGRHRLRRRRRRDDPAVGQARRPPRPQAAARARARRCSSRRPRSAGSRSAITMLVAARDRAGRRRGRADDARHGRRSATSSRRASAAATRATSRRRSRSRPSPARSSAALLVEHASWRWVFYVNLPLGHRRARRAAPRLPAPRARAAGARGSTCSAPRCSPAPPARCMLACIWGGDALRVGLGRDRRAVRRRARRSAAALVARERRAADPIVPLDLLRTRDGRGGERGAVPRHRDAVRDHRLRAAVPAAHHRRDARPRPGCCSCR